MATINQVPVSVSIYFWTCSIATKARKTTAYDRNITVLFVALIPFKFIVSTCNVHFTYLKHK